MYWQITALGQKLLRFPLDPRLASAIIESSSDNRNCVVEVTAIVAMLNVVEKLFYNSSDDGSSHLSVAQEFYSYDGDLVMLLRIYRAFCKLDSAEEKRNWCVTHCLKIAEMKRAVLIHGQLKTICHELKLPMTTCGEAGFSVAVRCFVRPYLSQIARLVQVDNGGKKRARNVHQKTSTYSREYRNPALGNLSLSLHPSSVVCRNSVAPEIVLYIECIETKKVHMRFVSIIKPDWVQ